MHATSELNARRWPPAERPVGYAAQRAMVVDLFADPETPPPAHGWHVGEVAGLTSLSVSRARDILVDLERTGVLVLAGTARPYRWAPAPTREATL